MKLKNRHSKKLQLSKETVRVLVQNEMKSVAGGTIPMPTDTQCYTTLALQQNNLG